MIFKVIYNIINGKRTAVIYLIIAPDVKNIRYSLIGDSTKYTLKEFKEIFPIVRKGGQELLLFIVSEEMKKIEEFGLNIFEKCPQNLTENNTTIAKWHIRIFKRNRIIKIEATGNQIP
jgi:hypothetical protein